MKTKAEEEFQLAFPKFQQNAHHHDTLNNSTTTCQMSEQVKYLPKRSCKKTRQMTNTRLWLGYRYNPQDWFHFLYSAAEIL